MFNDRKIIFISYLGRNEHNKSDTILSEKEINIINKLTYITEGKLIIYYNDFSQTYEIIFERFSKLLNENVAILISFSNYQISELKFYNVQNIILRLLYNNLRLIDDKILEKKRSGIIPNAELPAKTLQKCLNMF